MSFLSIVFSSMSEFFSKIWVLVLGFVVVFIFRKNKQLGLKNQQLEEEKESAEKILDIQNKVIDVRENIKPAGFAGVLERLRKNKL